MTAGLLAEHYPDLDQLMAADKEQLLSIEGIGEQVATAIVEYFTDPEVRAMIHRIVDAGLVVQPASNTTQQQLTNRIFVFTGGLQSISRTEAKQLVKNLGGQVASDISQRVTDVVIGAKAGEKRKKAQELGLPLLSEAEFLAIAATTPNGKPDGL